MTTENNEASLISNMRSHLEARRAYLSDVLIRLALVRIDEKYSLHTAVITFLERNEEIKDERRDYSDLLLVQKRLDIDSVCTLLQNLIETGTVQVDDLPINEVKVQVEQKFEFVPSKNRFGYVYFDWSTMYATLRINEPSSQLPSQPLVSLSYPLYPNGQKAVIDFLQLGSTTIPRNIIIQIPDYRAKIDDLFITGNKVSVKVSRSSIFHDELTVKFYAEYDSKTMHSPSFDFKEEDLEYEFEYEPKYVLVQVLDSDTGEQLDFRGFHFDYPGREGVTVELDQLEIKEILRRGENLNVEFKQGLKGSEEFLESVVAYANTKGGRIFIGVTDNGIITGFKPDNKDQITNLIVSNVEPNIMFDVNEYEVDGKPLTIVEISEGENKPYSHRQLGVYVRSGSTDRRATRPDLDDVYNKRRSISYRQY